MNNLLLDCLFLLDKDLPFWNVVFNLDLENLHQVLEFGRIFPVSTPNDNHHRLLEDSEPLGGIEDPCCCFTQVNAMPGIALLDNAENGVFFTWKDILEAFVIQLGNSTADTSKFLCGLLWVRTTRQLWFKLVFECRTPINVRWRVNTTDL